ncbi:MAG: twin-arginine translocase subunit TatB [Pseudomonadales bacterium]|nr:twin-arginine translocase subunit TatB [Pseudomonadales bacterium]
MLDIGFLELLLIATLTLLILGPERLPGVLRTLGLWLGRIRRAYNSIRKEIDREIGMDEIRRQLHNEQVLEEVKAIEKEVKAARESEKQIGASPPVGARSSQTSQDSEPVRHEAVAQGS